jgi:acyl-CoA reductase-like NAD-dependent aldehyde dehydrogenase
MTTQQQLDDARARSSLLTAERTSGVDASSFRRLARRVAMEADDRRASFAVRAPFTGEALGVLPRGTPDDVDGAVRRARAAQPAWAARSVRARARIMLRFHDLLLDRSEEALDLIQLESGKARRHALEEVLDTAVVALHYASHAARYLRPRRHRGALPLLTVAWELRHPVGVVGVIAPWNFPLILSITDVVAALMAGNAAVLVPDVQSSFTALWAAELLHHAGLPRDVFLVVTGEGRELGPALVDRVDFVMFTGSTRTGKLVARQAAERLVGASLELGGKNPMVVLEDASLERAVDGAVRGAFVGAGQVCVSTERIYVHASLYDRFAVRLAERARALRLGAALDYSADMGSLTTERQLATTEAHVRDALEKGAMLLAGGHRRPDLGALFFEPTVLAGVTPAMTLHAEETFGPVVALYPFESVDEAIARANATRYGLNASVWSRSTRRARAVARRLHAGTVNVNEAYAATWGSTASPIGGMKESGLGRRHGADGILKYTEAQTVAVQRGLPIAPPAFLPVDRYARVMTALVKVMRYVPGLR